MYNVHWPALAIKSLQKSVVQLCPCFTPTRRPLLLLQPYQKFHNVGETALWRAPTLQRLSLLRGCLVPPLGPVAFVAFCGLCFLACARLKRVKLCSFLPAADRGKSKCYGATRVAQKMAHQKCCPILRTKISL